MHVQQERGRVVVTETNLGVSVAVVRTEAGMRVMFRHDKRPEVISELIVKPQGGAPLRLFADNIEITATAITRATEGLAERETVDARLMMLRTRGSVSTPSASAASILRVVGRSVLVAADGPRAGCWLACGDMAQVTSYAQRNKIEICEAAS